MAAKTIQKPTRQADLPRSKGAVLLARTGLTSGEVATAVHVTEALVRHWRLGIRLPALDKRRSLAQQYAIPPEAWDEPAAIQAKQQSAPQDGAKLTSADFDRAAVRLFGAALQLIDQLGECETPLEVAKLAMGASVYLDKSARLAGISLDVTEAKLLRTPAWRRAKDRLFGVIFEALKPYPDAARAVGESLLALSADEQ